MFEQIARGADACEEARGGGDDQDRNFHLTNLAFRSGTPFLAYRLERPGSSLVTANTVARVIGRACGVLVSRAAQPERGMGCG